ncbi:MAG: Fe-S cluster assembly scaffold protein NifU [Candidatus Sumerlaeota bacterium]|nr:Fe-S cluster assembly scaffold protein NifU [Candidatus Sumerlaeota bacterium]
MQYTEKVIQTFMNPKNVGKIDDADGMGKVGNPQCGDIMQIFIKVKDNIITDIKFLTLGCAAAIATSSITTEMVKGKTIDEALKITNKDVMSALGGLPPEKLHCSVLAEQGIRAAIEDYLNKQKKD